MTNKKQILVYSGIVLTTATIATGVTLGWMVYNLLHWKVSLGNHTWHIHSRVDHREGK